MVTLTGTFTRLDGTPATGTVRVTPSRSPIMDPDGKIVISGPQTFPLDKDGKLTTEIPASNDPDLGPAFTYSIDVNLTHANWKISKVWIPHGSTTVDLSEIADYTPTPGVATRVVTIPADGRDGQVLVWDGAGFSWDFPPEGPEGPSGEIDGTVRVVNRMDREYTATAYYHSTASYLNLVPGHKFYARRNYNGPVQGASGSIRASNHVFIQGSEPISEITTYTGVAASGSTIVIYGVAGETHNFTDVVLVNLTETFGSGNEPGLAYMDNLVRREGGWFDRSSPIVGNVFYENVVVGQGMSLRHDTTVGTRVLLDHPGGTTMLYGDTGWRNVSNLLINGWTGQVEYRRVNDTHMLNVFSLNPTNATDVRFLSQLPSGLATARWRGGTFTLAMNWTRLVDPTTYASVPSVAQYGEIRWNTESSWPSTLPGTPL